MNWSRAVTITGYNDAWRSYRRILNNWLNRRTVTRFNALQGQKARLLLQRLLDATKHTQPFQGVHDELLL
jgi:hypothetical protein